MIKLQLTNEIGGFLVKEIKQDGVALNDDVYDSIIVYAKSIFKPDDVNTLALKKGIEIMLTDLVRDILYIDIKCNDMLFGVNMNLNDFLKATNYQAKFVKYVVKHNKTFGEVEVEQELNPNWESFLDTMFCRRDEEGHRPCEYCNEHCNEEWVSKAFEHYIDMKTYALPVLAE